MTVPQDSRAEKNPANAMELEKGAPAVPDDVQLLAPSGGRQVRVAQKTPKEITQVDRKTYKALTVPKKIPLGGPSTPSLSTPFSKGQKKAETSNPSLILGEIKLDKIATSVSQEPLDGSAEKEANPPLTTSKARVLSSVASMFKGQDDVPNNTSNTVVASTPMDENDTAKSSGMISIPQKEAMDRNQVADNLDKEYASPLIEKAVPFLLHSIPPDAELEIASKISKSLPGDMDPMDTTTLDESDINGPLVVIKNNQRSENTLLKSTAAKSGVKLKKNIIPPTEKENPNSKLPGTPTAMRIKPSQSKTKKTKMVRSEDRIIADERVKIAQHADNPVPSIQAYVDNVDQSEDTSTQGTQSKQGTQGRLARTEEIVMEGGGFESPTEGSAKMKDSSKALIKDGYNGQSDITAPTLPAPKTTHRKPPPQQPSRGGPPRKRSVQGIHPRFSSNPKFSSPTALFFSRLQADISGDNDADESHSDDDEPLSKKARKLREMNSVKEGGGKERNVREVRRHRREKHKEMSSGSEYTEVESTVDSDLISTPSDSTATKKRDRATMARMRSEQKLGRGVARKTRGSMKSNMANLQATGEIGGDSNNGNAGLYGRLVWAKCAKFPYWPGMVVPHQNYLFLKDPDFDKKAPKDSLCVHFFADGCLATVPTRHIYSYDDNRNLQIDEGDYASQVEQAREAADRVFKLYGHSYPRLRSSVTSNNEVVPLSLPGSDNDIMKDTPDVPEKAQGPKGQKSSNEIEHYKTRLQSKDVELKAANEKIAELQQNLSKIEGFFQSIKTDK